MPQVVIVPHSDGSMFAQVGFSLVALIILALMVHLWIQDRKGR